MQKTLQKEDAGHLSHCSVHTDVRYARLPSQSCAGNWTRYFSCSNNLQLIFNNTPELRTRDNGMQGSCC